MYEMENEIPFTRTDPQGKLKLHEAAAMMANCCQFQEYQEKAFCEFLRKNNIAIFLFSIQIDIVRMPSFREKIKTAVRIYGCKSIYGLRQITMRDERGALCLIANATGAFFNTKEGKAVKIAPEDFPVKWDTPEEMECLPRKIPVPSEGGTDLAPYTVVPSDLDLNGHLTTPAYFAIAGNVLPDGFGYNRVRMEFKKQALPGEVILPRLYRKDLSTVVTDLKSENGNSFATAEFTTTPSINKEK